MLSSTHILLILCIAFTGGLIRSSFGFGDALFMMPLLTLTIGIRYATPLVGMITVTQATLIIWGHWKYVDLNSSWRLVLASFVGIPIGLYGLKNVSEDIVMMFLGLILVGYSLYNLFAPPLPHLKHENYAFPFGFVSGVIGGAYNIKGPPIVIYGMLRRWSPELFRVTLQSYFIPTGFVIMLSHLLGGLWNYEVVSLYVFSLPLLIIAAVLGALISAHVPDRLFKRLIYMFLILIGLVMIF